MHRDDQAETQGKREGRLIRALLIKVLERRREWRDGLIGRRRGF